MAAMLYLMTGPPGVDLTGRLLADYRVAARDIGTALWLAPSRRAADQVLSRIVSAGAILAPNVLSLEDFALEIVQSRASSRAHQRRIIDDCIAEVHDGKGLGYFKRVVTTRGFAAAAEGFVAEVQALGISPVDFARAAGGRSEKLAACARLLEAVGGRGEIDSPIAVAGRFLQKSLGLPGPFARVRSVFVDGFSTFSPTELTVLAGLAAIVAEVRISLPDEEGEDRSETFATPRDVSIRLSENGEAGEPSLDGVFNPRPAGLAHLQQNLFRPCVEPTMDAAGVHLIEAPGELGEARLVARHVRRLLNAGTPADAIVVTGRDLSDKFDLLGEVFDEYVIPTELSGEEPILRNPAIGTLLRATRLPDDDWAFAGVTALLRSTYFRPADEDADTIRHSEGLLRLLGEPRDRDAYLRAVTQWSEAPPDALEDEGGDEPRRLRTARLASECRPFLERFFQSWDDLPTTATPEAFTAWLRQFSEKMGVWATADARDRAALTALFLGLDEWRGRPVARAASGRRLSAIAAATMLPRSPPALGCVRVVPAEDARHIDCDTLIIVGLGEKSFPKVIAPESLLDDGDRATLRGAGLPFPDPADRLGDEQLLFLQLVARPRRELVLSYAAVDEKGQPRLPGSFLRAATDAFAPGTVATTRQRMLIEGYATREPLSAAEARVRFAVSRRGSAAGPWRYPGLADDLCDHLRAADQVATARFRGREFTPYDGLLDNPAAVAAVAARFSPDKVFSPTALETYVACPFRFLLEHVLRLEDLAEPGEDVERTRRGAAFHRALARLHRNIGTDLPTKNVPETVDADLVAELDRAVAEYVARAPSAAAKVLWQLEGKRLHRSAAKYRGHWDGFLDPWRKQAMHIVPRLLEADFGLPAPAAQIQPATVEASMEPLIINVGDVEVRIGGRIDRVDVAEIADGLGFWVIDYKTGRATNYTASDLMRFEKLQLSLYALAVEKVFFPGRQARPLGLAYWLVTDTGPKPVLPGSGTKTMAWLADADKWAKFRGQLEEWVATLVGRLRAGQFPLAPRSEHCTDTCPFGQVCRITQSRGVGKLWDLKLPG